MNILMRLSNINGARQTQQYVTLLQDRYTTLGHTNILEPILARTTS